MLKWRVRLLKLDLPFSSSFIDDVLSRYRTLPDVVSVQDIVGYSQALSLEEVHGPFTRADLSSAATN